ncbi:hypothetical protein H4219_004310 [Mycoemilia scoparia]|uniref:Tyrosinase copper-binding domain-containing protein n=1 Tax=Mycoemilia scoparia TaxID=417184 RepID=A0A9W8DRK8_9FUNG|nr:hypothetical protein H4219_004310 [Mycoemilia scoparia]
MVSAQDLPPFSLQNTACTQPAVRKELRRLTSDEKDRFMRALSEMHRRGWMDSFARLHDTASHNIHGNDLFLIWHRAYIQHFESALQSIEPGLSLPYWDWSIDAASPENSEILGPAWFGGNGAGWNGCIMDGLEANWGKLYPQRSCIQRAYRYGRSTGAFWPTGALNSIIQTSRSYSQLRTSIENGSHGVVHLGLGGDFSTMWAPIDPIFFMHHSMIDRLFLQWQMGDPGSRRFEVNGMDANNNWIGPNTRLPFYGITAREAVDAFSNGFCYTYDDVRPPDGLQPAATATSPQGQARNAAKVVPNIVTQIVQPNNNQRPVKTVVVPPAQPDPRIIAARPEPRVHAVLASSLQRQNQQQPQPQIQQGNIFNPNQFAQPRFRQLSRPAPQPLFRPISPFGVNQFANRFNSPPMNNRVLQFQRPQPQFGRNFIPGRRFFRRDGESEKDQEADDDDEADGASGVNRDTDSSNRAGEVDAESESEPSDDDSDEGNEEGGDEDEDLESVAESDETEDDSSSANLQRDGKPSNGTDAKQAPAYEASPASSSSKHIRVPDIPQEWILSQKLDPAEAKRLHDFVNKYIQENGAI